MDASVKEEPSKVTEEMDALYEDVMENGVKMETIEVDDLLTSTDEPSCTSRPPGATTTPRRENTKLMIIDVRRSANEAVVTPTYSARSMWSQKATPRTPASATAKRFTVIVPRKTPYDKRFQRRQGEYAAKTGIPMQANIGMNSARIVSDGEEASRECSDEKADMTRDEQSASVKDYDAIGTAKACAEARSALQAEADRFPAANGSNDAHVEVDIGEPTDIAAEAPFDAVQASTKEPDDQMIPGLRNSDTAVGPTRPLEAISTARKALKTPGGRADRRKQELNTTKNGNDVLDVLDEEQAVIVQKKKKRSYTIEEKLRVVEYAMQTSIRAAARDLEYNPNTVKDWCRHADWARQGKRPC